MEHPVVRIVLPDRPGALADVVRLVSESGLDIEYVYQGNHDTLLVRTEEIERMENFLIEGGFRVLGPGDLADARGAAPVVTSDQFLQYIFSGITSGSVYALTAIGFTLVFSATHIINFAQGQMVMLGGMLGVTLYDAGLPIWACFLGAVVMVALISVAMEEVAIRPLMKKGVLAQIIATVGASFVFETAAMLIWGRDARTMPPFSGEQPITSARPPSSRRPCGW